MCMEGEMRKAIEKFLSSISPESKVSLDPNFVEDISSMQDFFKPFIDRSDLILPSEGEAKMLLGTQEDEEALSFSSPGKIIALKQGDRGCTIFEGDKRIKIPSFRVDEVDPTGCGAFLLVPDSFRDVTRWPLEMVGQFANATGALQATAVGPMEGAKYLQEVLNFIESNKI